jgi:transcriptional regulator with XRE-family HTH domain
VTTRKAKSSLTTEFGKHLRLVRGQHGLSQEELAARAKLHRTYISLLERGVQSATLDTMEKIADALGISVKKLMPR